MKNLYRCIIGFYKNLSIKYKLLLLFYIQIIIPLFFIGYMSYQKSSQIIKMKSINYSQDILKLIDLRFNDLSNNMKALTMEMLMDNRTYSVLNSNSNDFSHVSEARDVLREAALSRNEIQSICIVNNEGNLYPFDQNVAISNIQAMLPYKKIMDKGKGNRGNLFWYIDKSGKDVKNIYVARIINDRDNYKPIGLLAILIKRDFVESIYNGLSTQSIKNIAIVSDEGDTIIGKFNTNNYTKYYTGEMGYYIDKKTKVLISYTNLLDPKWKVIYHIPLSELYSQINSLRNWTLLMVIMGLLILSVLSILTSVDIVDPINKLVNGMKKVEKGTGYEKIELKRNDELGYLSESFNRMSEKIDYLVNCMYKEELTRKEAEIKALQAQINPHFLFNTLESINWMAQLNGIPEISETVSALASIMDASIGRDDKLITLRDEFTYIDNYIVILKNRYEDGLEVKREIDEETLDISIPRLLIQPLVENAIYHGVEKVRRKGVIKLRSYFKEENVVVEVIDNGIGMNEEELQIIKRRLKEEESVGFIKEKKKSVGLENVNRRVKLFYGNEFGINIDSKYNEYTKVILTIPFHQKMKG